MILLLLIATRPGIHADEGNVWVLRELSSKPESVWRGSNARTGVRPYKATYSETDRCVAKPALVVILVR